MAALALVERDRESAQPGRSTRAVQVIDDQARARALAVVLRAVLILVIVIEPGATGDREHFRYDVEVGRYECRALLVTALYIFAERRVGIRAQTRMAREGTGGGSDG